MGYKAKVALSLGKFKGCNTNNKTPITKAGLRSCLFYYYQTSEKTSINNLTLDTSIDVMSTLLSCVHHDFFNINLRFS